MKWSEQVAFSRRMRRYMGEYIPLWGHLMVGGGLTTVMLLAGLVGYVLHGNGGGWPLVWLALGLGLSLGLATYFGNAWTASIIRLTDKGIDRQFFRGITVYLERWHWSEIACCRLERIEDEGREFDILAVYSPSGQCVPLGLPRSMPVEKLQQWFEGKKVSFQLRASVEPIPLTQILSNLFTPSATQEASVAG